MKIALDIRKIGRRQTGDETYIVNLVLGLAKIDAENTYYLCTDSLENESQARKILGSLSANFSFAVLKPGSKLSWTRKALPKFAKKEGIDVVHVQYITPQKAMPKTRLITTIHDVSFKRFPKYIKWKDRLILNRFIPRSLKRADKIIAVSAFTRREILDVYSKIVAPEKVEVVYNGVDKEAFVSKESLGKMYLERMRSKYGLGQRYIFHISSLQPRKKVPFLIDAFREYLRNTGDERTNLVIAGKKGHNYDEEIELLFRDPVLKQRVKMIGYVKEEDLGGLYAFADLYVSSSAYEGFDLPLLEAMQSGVPVLASKGSCHEEIVGKAGTLFSLKNKGDLADKMDIGLNDQGVRRRLIEEGKRRARDFSWERCARETLAVYTSKS